MSDNDIRFIVWMAYDATPSQWSIEKARKMAAAVSDRDVARWMQLRTR